MIGRRMCKAPVEALFGMLDGDQDVLSRVMALVAGTSGYELSVLLGIIKVEICRSNEICKLFLRQIVARDRWLRQVACQGLAEAGSISLEMLQVVLHSQDSQDWLGIFGRYFSFSEARYYKAWIQFWLDKQVSADFNHRYAAMCVLRNLVEDVVEVRQRVLEQLMGASADFRLNSTLSDCRRS